jgi:hypothetical protein
MKYKVAKAVGAGRSLAFSYKCYFFISDLSQKAILSKG